MINVLQSIARWWYATRFTSRLESGDICVVKSGEDQHGIAKVLKVDPTVIHVALYKNRYTVPPTHVDPAVLQIGRIDDQDCGIGHLPLSRAMFGSWLPRPIQREPVTDDELEGYRYWEKDAGGVWS